MKRLWVACVLSLMLSMGVWAATVPTPIDTLVLAEAEYSVGSYTLPAVPIPMGYTVGTLSVARASWTNPTSILTWEIQVSVDGGSTWNQVPGVQGSTNGGIRIDPATGLPRTQSVIAVSLPQPENPDRMVRGVVSVAGSSIITSVRAGLR